MVKLVIQRTLIAQAQQVVRIVLVDDVNLTCAKNNKVQDIVLWCR